VTADGDLLGVVMQTWGGGDFSNWLVATMLVSVRLTVAVGLSPAFSAFGLPAMVRLVLVMLLAAISQAAVPSIQQVALATTSGLIEAIAAEVFLGMLLGFGVHVVLAAFAVAGRLLDVQSGFGIGSVFDPVSRSNQNVMGALMSIVGVTLFFLTDAHLALAAMLARSTEVFPVGRFPPLSDPMPLLSGAGAMFAAGLALAAPVSLALVLTDLFVGVVSRNMPQINVLVLAMPLKVLIAYFVLAVSVRARGPVIQRLFGLVSDVMGAR
jgi:flagellar biosynthetic protein FliR